MWPQQNTTETSPLKDIRHKVQVRDTEDSRIHLLIKTGNQVTYGVESHENKQVSSLTHWSWSL